MQKILILDDDEAIREIFEIILGDAGFELTIQSNGDELLKQDFEEPDLFLIDKQLQGVDGLDICRFLKSRATHASTPVVIISASNKVEKPALEAGADAFLEKPFRKKTFLALIEQMIDKKQPT